MTVRWSSFTKGVMVVGLLLAGVWLLNRFNALIAPTITALLVAYLLNLPVNLLIRRSGISRTLATVLVFLVAIVLLVAVPALLGPRLVDQVVALQIDLRGVELGLQHLFAEPIEILSVRIEPQTLFDQITRTLGELLSPVAGGALAVLAGAFQTLGWVLYVLVISFLLVKDANVIGSAIGQRIPPDIAPDFYQLGRELNDIWNAFLRGRLVLGMVIGFIAAVAMTIIGMPNPVTLGIITGVLTFIPTIGPWLAGILAVLVALGSDNTLLGFSNFWYVVLVAGIYFILFQIESLYLLPRIVGRRVQLHPLVVIVGTLAGALVAGVLGILLAAPVIASARVLLSYIYHKLLDQEPFGPPQEIPENMGIDWRGYIHGHPISAVLFDLDGTLVETDDNAVDDLATRLARFRLFLPQGDSQRVARRLLMWASEEYNRWLAILDRFGLDNSAQNLIRWLGLVQAQSIPDLVPVDGALELLHRLGGRYRLGIVSTRSEEEIRSFLDIHGLNGRMQVVVGCDTTDRIKPHPQPILWAADQLGVFPDDVVMVGDTLVDIRSAKAAGTLAVGVLCGFGEREDFQQADLVLETTADLAEWL
ncbi:MAG: AI-2E family transporter [Chloroflexota bacterium]|nr:AI-2E family transporter [Chloroflexota bacterium]